MVESVVSVTVLLGLQWGDEGKGKMVDLLADKADCIARFQGGNNAGHTIWHNGNQYVFHLIPSGILREGKICAIGNGVVVEPEALLKEIDYCKKEGTDVEGRLFVSQNAHVILPYHRYLDISREDGKKPIGTTRRGIGPAYADKISRTGLRVGDLLEEDVLTERLRENIEEKKKLFACFGYHFPLDFDQLIKHCTEVGRRMRPYVRDTIELFHNLLREGRAILLEGAQGTLLDIDFGTYPYVTSSNSSSAGACSGTGIPPTRISEIIGVMKAYTTRIGRGPFPTEMSNPMDKMMRDKGEEYGATTGRARRCGWLDLVATKFAVEVNGATQIALTKLDVLSGLDEIKVCTTYEFNGERLTRFPLAARHLDQVIPVYEHLPPWEKPIKGITKWEKLPANAKRYVEFIQDYLKVPVKFISTGCSREETIIL